MSERNRRLVSLGNVVQFAVLALAICATPVHAESFGVFDGHDELVYMIGLSNDGRVLVSASGDNTAILWDLQQRVVLHVLHHDAAVYAVAISPDGRSIATATGDGRVALWSRQDGSLIVSVNEHHDAVYCLAFSPDGNQLASAGGSTDGGDTVCRIWRAGDLKLVTELAGHARQVYGVVFSPDGQTVATSSSDKTIRLWNTGSWKSSVLQGHTSDVYRCAYSPDGKLLASASQDGSVRVWTVQTRAGMVVFEGAKKDPMYAVAFSRDGRQLAAVGDDQHLRIWQTNGMRLSSDQRVSRRALYSVVFLPDQVSTAVAGEDGKIYAVPMNSSP